MKPALTKEQVFHRIRGRYGPSDLDEHVHEVMSGKAAEVNNGGLDSQLEFLHAEAGLDWLVETFLNDE